MPSPIFSIADLSKPSSQEMEELRCNDAECWANDAECWACKDLESWDVIKHNTILPSNSWLVGGSAVALVDNIMFGRQTTFGDQDFLFSKENPVSMNMIWPNTHKQSNGSVRAVKAYALYGVSDVIRIPDADFINAKICRVKVILNYDLSCVHLFATANAIYVRRLKETFIDRTAIWYRPINMLNLNGEFRIVGRDSFSIRTNKYKERGFNIRLLGLLEHTLVSQLNMLAQIYGVGLRLSEDSIEMLMKSEGVAFFIALAGPADLQERAYNTAPTWLKK